MTITQLIQNLRNIERREGDIECVKLHHGLGKKYYLSIEDMEVFPALSMYTRHDGIYLRYDLDDTNIKDRSGLVKVVNLLYDKEIER